MKKLLIFLMTIFGAFSLASCSNEISYDLIKTDQTPLYENWFSKAGFQDFPIYDENAKPENTRYEIFLPESIDAASRYAVSDIEDAFLGNNRKVAISYFALYNLSNVTNEICRQVSTKYSGRIKDGYKNVKPTDFTKQWITNISLAELNDVEKFPAVEGEKRAIAVLYMPVKIDFYLAKENENAVKILETYAIVPTCYQLTYIKADGSLKDQVFNEGYEKVELNIGSDRILDSLVSE